MEIAAFGVRSRLCSWESSSPMQKTQSKKSPKSQADKFREAETDDREDAFDAALKKIAKTSSKDSGGEKAQK